MTDPRSSPGKEGELDISIGDSTMASNMNSSEKIFNKVSGLWKNLLNPLKESLHSRKITDADAKNCLTPMMQQDFKSVDS